MRRSLIASLSVVSAVLLAGCGVDPSAAPPASAPAASAVAQTPAKAHAERKEAETKTGAEKGTGEGRQGIGAPPPPPTLPDASAAAQDAQPEDERGPPRRGAPERFGGGKRLRSKVKSATASSASGRLSSSQVESVIDANIDQLGACVGVEGAVVTIRALVSPSGKVLEATSPKSSPDDPRVRDCVAQAFKHLEFPSATGGANAPLAFDLSLESAS